MPRKKNPLMLDIDENFIPVTMEEGEESYQNGIFVFNITKMLKFIEENKEDIDVGEISVAEYRSEWSIINHRHLDNVDITFPIILAEICPGTYSVIDGHHRLEKAFRMGIENIPAYKLKAKQHIPFLTDKEAYRAYIEYWNSKIRDGHKPF